MSDRHPSRDASSGLPTVGQITELPDPVSGAVTGEHIDSNGHMNVVHYLDFGALGADALVRSAGIDDAYRTERRLGVFTAEHHLRYFSELLEHDEFDVHARILARNDTVVHLITFLLDRSRQRLSSTLEIVLVHVDLVTRRPTPMPKDVTEKYDRHIAFAGGLGWAAPICGAMGIRS